MSVPVASLKTEPLVPWGDLPHEMRVLLITGPDRAGGWLAKALAADRASQVRLEEALGVTAGMARLRDEVFDAVIISHQPTDLDALELTEGIRAGNCEDVPVIVLGADSEPAMASLAFEAGVDAYLCIPATTTRALIWHLARARERHCLIAENRRLRQQQQQRLKREQDEAGRLLRQQWALIQAPRPIPADGGADGENTPPPARPSSPPATPLSDGLVTHYRELLRAYVVMGTGNLSQELVRLVGRLAAAHVSPRGALQLHLQVLEEMVAGLGHRSTRHVMDRADLLALEIMLQLAEGHPSAEIL